MNKPHEFWITNISKKNVCLRDLGFTIPKGRSYNLLDYKHFSYTLEQLEASALTGSIFKKSDKIKVRNVPPQVAVKPGIYVLNESRGRKNRSLVEIIEKRYEELDISDEAFAEQLASMEEEPKEENTKKK